MRTPYPKRKRCAWIFKRVFDLIAATGTVLFFSPILFVLFFVVRKNMGQPVLFTQQRPGLSGAPFTIYKFRTMTHCCDDQGRLLPDGDRIPPLGQRLRSTSLDELPELLNVIRGDMSIVGPRPLLMQYLDRYTLEQARRHEVKPGLTGWAQVNGRNALSWEEKFAMDVWYVDNWSFKLDLKIIYMSVWSVFKREGISQAGHATVEYFQGNRDAQNSTST
ncbi:bacterial sugar transferase [delta proteobacterium NaphS2]|nr:bacterial sugar transferase [delta proteobacterium NaphS2]